METSNIALENVFDILLKKRAFIITLLCHSRVMLHCTGYSEVCTFECKPLIKNMWFPFPSLAGIREEFASQLVVSLGNNCNRTLDVFEEKRAI
jgi:hypothetical protein